MDARISKFIQGRFSLFIKMGKLLHTVTQEIWFQNSRSKAKGWYLCKWSKSKNERSESSFIQTGNWKNNE